MTSLVLATPQASYMQRQLAGMHLHAVLCKSLAASKLLLMCSAMYAPEMCCCEPTVRECIAMLLTFTGGPQ